MNKTRQQVKTGLKQIFPNACKIHIFGGNHFKDSNVEFYTDCPDLIQVEIRQPHKVPSFKLCNKISLPPEIIKKALKFLINYEFDNITVLNYDDSPYTVIRLDFMENSKVIKK